VEEFYFGKAAKAVHWQAKGHTIEVLTEDDFFGMLEEKTSSGTRQGRTQNALARAVRRVVRTVVILAGPLVLGPGCLSSWYAGVD
jgi:hypothetical protein